jgi:osmotically inducible protein OsmC
MDALSPGARTGPLRPDLVKSRGFVQYRNRPATPYPRRRSIFGEQAMASYTAHATTVGGRNGHVETSDGVLKADLSIPKEIGGPGKPGASNPEEFFAAGFSACFGSAVEYLAKLEKLKAGPVTVTADVTLHASESGFHLSAHLKTHVEGLDKAAVEKLVHKAHNDVCPYSKATRNNIEVTLEVV